MDEAKQLCLNADKTHLLVIGTAQRLRRLDLENSVNIKMDNYALAQSEGNYEDLLGVRIQANWKWSQHISELRKRLKTRLNGLCKIKYIVGQNFRKTIAEGIFTSVLTTA